MYHPSYLIYSPYDYPTRALGYPHYLEACVIVWIYHLWNFCTWLQEYSPSAKVTSANRKINTGNSRFRSVPTCCDIQLWWLQCTRLWITNVICHLLNSIWGVDHVEQSMANERTIERWKLWWSECLTQVGLSVCSLQDVNKMHRVPVWKTTQTMLSW